MMHTWRLKCQRSHPRGSPRTPLPLEFCWCLPSGSVPLSVRCTNTSQKSWEPAWAGLTLPFAACFGHGWLLWCALALLITCSFQLSPSFLLLSTAGCGFNASGRGGLNKDRPNICRFLFVFQMWWTWLSSDPSCVSAGISSSAGLAWNPSEPCLASCQTCQLGIILIHDKIYILDVTSSKTVLIMYCQS